MHPIATHRVVTLGIRIEHSETLAMARCATTVENHILIKIAKILEHQAKNPRIRSSVSASASISAWVV